MFRHYYQHVFRMKTYETFLIAIKNLDHYPMTAFHNFHDIKADLCFVITCAMICTKLPLPHFSCH